MRVLMLSTLLCLASAHAYAHPHVWIDNTASLILTHGQLTAIQVNWTFDELTSSQIIEEFDPNADGTFSAPELTAMQEALKDSLPETNYYMRFFPPAGTTPAVKNLEDLHPNTDFHPPTAFTATIQQKDDEKRITYHLTLPLKYPFAVAGQTFKLSFLDNSYYTEVTTLENELALGTPTCTKTWGEDREHPIYMGMVFPDTFTITCAGA
ncbi:MAG: DUF1007 family protein [Alphaproteobacteria bacterium]